MTGRATLLLAGLLLAGMVRAEANLPVARPNILLLVAEDLGHRIGAYGDSVARTPTLDRLARESVRFTRVFTTAGVCAPSRAALIMGQHQISFGAQHMRTSTGPLGEYYAQPDAGAKAFPELLRAAGYFTFTDGKLDYQFSGVAAGSGPFTIWDEEGAEAHWRHRPPGQPFFGMINFMATHESGVMRMDVEPYNALHARSQQLRAAAGMVAEPMTDPADVALPPYYPDIPEVRADLARHYDNIRVMDAEVGRILAELDADGLREQTIIVWTTDHGDGLPRAKRELLDSGIHVPMLVDVPDAWQPPVGPRSVGPRSVGPRSVGPRSVGPRSVWRPGSDDDRLVSFVDLAPTILAWAGIDAPPQSQGSNFLTSERSFVFASRDRIDEVMDRQRAVRDARYKYIRSWYPQTPGGHELAYRDNLDMVRAMRALFLAGRLNPAQARWFEPPGEEQLYDLQTDPHELDNRIDDPSLRATRARLRGALIDWLARVGDTGAEPEAELRARLLVDGQVPVTPPPAVEWDGTRLVARVAESASIGYRTDGGPWRLYTGPTEQTATTLEVKAVRYGWRESPLVTIGAEATGQKPIDGE